MRSATTAQNAALTAQYFTPGLRVLVADADGNLRDWSNQAGHNWIDSVEIDLDIDQPVSAATVQFRRDAGATLSLAPFRSDSTLNVYSGGYAPAIAPGRLIIIQAASVAVNTTPVTSDFVEIWRGFVDRVTWAASGEVVTARDLASINQDKFVKTETVYGSTGGQPLETVMQNILNDWGDGSTLFVPVSPSFLITTYKQQSQSVMDALLALAQTAGWTVGVVWDSGTSAYRLTLYDPNRTKSVADQSISASRYLSVSDLFIDRVNIRNNIQVNYFDSSLGVMTPMIRFDSASQTEYGDRWFGITEASTSPINNATQALAMCQAVLADLKDPKAEHEIEMHFDWRIELCDLLKFLANGVHYNADQSEAVVTLTHKLTNTSQRTTVRTRGEPAGQFFGWFTRGVGVQPTQGPSLVVTSHQSGSNIVIVWSGDDVTLSIDGGTPAAPSASPITVAMNAAGGAVKKYAFSGFRDGVQISTEVDVPPLSGSTAPSGTLTPTLTNNQVDDTTSSVTCIANASNLPTTYTWAVYRGFSQGAENLVTSIFSGSNSSNPLGGGGFSFTVTPQLKNSFWYLLVITTPLGNYTAEMQVQGKEPFLANTTGQAATGATDSTGRAVNTSYDKPISADPDNYDSLTNGLTFGGTRLTALDNGKPNTLYNSTSGVSQDTELFSGAVGATVANVIANGGGQDGALTGQASGWTFGAGQALTCVNTSSFVGDRSLQTTHGSAASSHSSQSFAVLATDVWSVEGWILCNSTTTPATGVGAWLELTGVAFDFLDTVGVTGTFSTSDRAIGVPTTGSFQSWQYVKATFQPRAAGTMLLHCSFGFLGTIVGVANWDGVILQKLTPAIPQGGVRGFNALDSNNQVASNRNLQMIASGGPVGTYQQYTHGTTTPLNPVTSSGTTVNVAAHDTRFGSGAVVSYSSGSDGWAAGVVCYVYCNDPLRAGGTGTSGWGYSNTLDTIYNNDSIYFAGQVTPAGSGGGGGITCPAPDEPILLADGREIRAGDLRAGDMVRTAHEVSGKWGSYRVARVNRIALTGRTRLVLLDGREIVATADHPVYVECEDSPERVVKTQVLRLRPGMRLAGATPGVVSHVEDASIGPVMVIEVEDAHTYVLRGILSHNKIPQ